MNSCHKEPQEADKRPRRGEKPISGVYPVIDNDLARDNIENDIPAADLEDL
ncbi:MAG: hypothetical protein ACI3WR_00165 [Oscillospiraceae bacterium]